MKTENDVINVKASNLGEFMEFIKDRDPIISYKPYKLNIEGFTRESVEILRKYPEKSIDLSETIISDETMDMRNYFSDCKCLVVPPRIPDGVIDMSNCFAWCSKLVIEPQIPSSVIDMDGCFLDCEHLRNPPTLPSGIKDIDNCFKGCTRLLEAPVIPAGVMYMFGCFNGCELIEKAPEIPHGVKDLSYCFNNCKHLIMPPQIPNGVTDMHFCFCGCERLKETPILPPSVTDMNTCYKNCKSLVEVSNIPKNAKVLPWCFEGCENLKKVPAISKQIIELYECFHGCPNLENITVHYNRNCKYRDFVDIATIKKIETDEPNLLCNKLTTFSGLSEKQVTSLVVPIGVEIKKTVFDNYIDKIKEVLPHTQNIDIDTIFKTGRKVLASLPVEERNEISKAFASYGITSEQKLGAFIQKTAVPAHNKKTEKTKNIAPCYER